MAEIKIRQDRCKGCFLCMTACPKALIKRAKKHNKKGIYVVETKSEMERECIGCCLCAIMCPDSAIEVYKTA